MDMDIDDIQSRSVDALLSGNKLPYDKEDELDWEVDSLEETADPPTTQPAQPATPLSSNTGLLNAITDIQTGAPGSRTDGGFRDLRAMIGTWMKEADDEAKAALDAQRKAAEDARNKRPRSSPTGSPVGPAKKSMNAWGKAPALSAGDDKSAAIDFDSMLDNVRTVPCAIALHKLGVVIGNPTTIGSIPGMSIKLSLNPGKLAMPSLGLDFAISKAGLDSAKEVDYNTFNVSWEAGVEIACNFMMEHLHLSAHAIWT